jgi:DNA-binding FrmR family transcriptional regulator
VETSTAAPSAVPTEPSGPVSHPEPPGEHSRGYTGDKEVWLKRLRRIEGQVRGLGRMVEQDAYCIDVLTQVSAATKALQAVALGLLTEHLGHCVAHAGPGQDGIDAKVREASEAIARLVRS